VWTKINKYALLQNVYPRPFLVSRGGQTGPPLPGGHGKSWPSNGGLLCPPRLIDLPRRAPKEAHHGKPFGKKQKEEEKPTRAWIWAALDLDLAVDVDPPPSPGSAAAPARSRHRQIRRRRLRPDRPRLDPPDVEEEGGAHGRSGLPGHATAGSAAGASTGAAPAWIYPLAPGSLQSRRCMPSREKLMLSAGSGNSGGTSSAGGDTSQVPLGRP